MLDNTIHIQMPISNSGFLLQPSFQSFNTRSGTAAKREKGHGDRDRSGNIPKHVVVDVYEYNEMSEHSDAIPLTQPCRIVDEKQILILQILVLYLRQNYKQ